MESVKRGVASVSPECGVEIVKCGVWSLGCDCAVIAKCEVWSLKCGV